MEVKLPFAGPGQVIEYLGRYTHRVAISNNRIVSDEKGRVNFTYRDRADGNKLKSVSLDAKVMIHEIPG